jgi:hypothetical protein
MSADRSDATVVTLRYSDGRGQRLRIEPRSDGRHDVVEEVETRGDGFREVGHEVADQVAVESPE